MTDTKENTTIRHEILSKVQDSGNEKLLLEISDLLKKDYEQEKKWTYCRLHYRELKNDLEFEKEEDVSLFFVPHVYMRSMLVKVKTKLIPQLKAELPKNEFHDGSGLGAGLAVYSSNGCHCLPMFKVAIDEWEKITWKLQKELITVGNVSVLTRECRLTKLEVVV